MLAKKQHSHFFVLSSLPSLHHHYVKLPNSTFSGGREHKTTTLFFLNFDTVL